MVPRWKHPPATVKVKSPLDSWRGRMAKDQILFAAVATPGGWSKCPSGGFFESGRIINLQDKGLKGSEIGHKIGRDCIF